MGFIESIKTCFRKYIDFSGRASRSEYWWFFLFSVIVRLATTWIIGVGFIIGLVLLLPSLAVTARRLHDTNRTGWWILMPIGAGIAGIVAGGIAALTGTLFAGVALAILGSIAGYLVLLWFLIQPSDPGVNRYGPNPFQAASGGYGHPDSPYDAPPMLGGEAAPPDATAGASPSGRRYCAQCGMQLYPSAQFCTVCGAQA